MVMSHDCQNLSEGRFAIIKGYREMIKTAEKAELTADTLGCLYEYQLVECKKSVAAKANINAKDSREWAEAILELFPSFDITWKMLLDKDKLNEIMTEAKAILKEHNENIRKRDDAVRKNEPLHRKLAQKDIDLIEKDALYQRAQDLHDKRIQELNEKLTGIELTLDSKNAEISRSNEYVDKVKDT